MQGISRTACRPPRAETINANLLAFLQILQEIWVPWLLEHPTTRVP
jgi:hypothetical protein